ncbi:hypothetical protein [Kordia sp.]|uniref:hypothetical protein n=1 Tax=Kordia sp. TaxID=1965332 RepID=UPI003D6A7E3F
MRIKLLFLVVIGLQFAIAQIDFKKEIVGSWELNAIVGKLQHGEKDPFISSEVSLTFKKDAVLLMEVQDFVLEATYTLEDNVLTIGKKQYKIESIEANKMILKPIDKKIKLRYNYKRKSKDE